MSCILDHDFNVGDLVVIRDWDDMAAEFGVNRQGTPIPSIPCKFTFIEGMRYLCNTEHTITRIKDNGRVFLDPPVDGYSISTDMIRRADFAEVPEIDTDSLLGILGA